MPDSDRCWLGLGALSGWVKSVTQLARLLPLLCVLVLRSVGGAGATTQPSEELIAAERVASQLKAGTVSQSARKLVEDSRIGDRYYWNDAFKAGLDRFQVDQDAYLLLKYQHLQDPLNTSPGDRLAVAEIARFADLRSIIGADLFPSIEQINASPLAGIHFQPVYLIRSVNALRQSGKQNAIASLRKYLELADWSPEREDRIYKYGIDAVRVSLITRLLFVPRGKDTKMLSPMDVMVGTSPASEGVKTEYPLFPLVLQKGIPFDLSNGRYGGDASSPSQEVDYCEANCDLRSNDLAPESSPLEAAESLLRSPGWTREIVRKYPDDDVASAESLVRVQALRAVSLRLSAESVTKDSIDEIPDAAWKAALANRNFSGLQWDGTKQEFRIGNK